MGQHNISIKQCPKIDSQDSSSKTSLHRGQLRNCFGFDWPLPAVRTDSDILVVAEDIDHTFVVVDMVADTVVDIDYYTADCNLAAHIPVEDIAADTAVRIVGDSPCLHSFVWELFPPR